MTMPSTLSLPHVDSYILLELEELLFNLLLTFGLIIALDLPPSLQTSTCHLLGELSCNLEMNSYVPSMLLRAMGAIVTQHRPPPRCIKLVPILPVDHIPARHLVLAHAIVNNAIVHHPDTDLVVIKLLPT